MTRRNANEVTGPHSEWLTNEYNQWVQALSECTVHNFKEHPMVKRMLGEPRLVEWSNKITNPIHTTTWDIIYKLDHIGRLSGGAVTGMCIRMIYYSIEVYKRNPSSIIEIGGGVGQFYAILRALGWKGKYRIIDLPAVCAFQCEYLAEVARQTGLDTSLDYGATEFEMLVSFYALGEFDDDTKRSYKGLINSVPHGYVAWNSHSGASDDLSIFKHDIKVTPGIEPGIKIITW